MCPLVQSTSTPIMSTASRSDFPCSKSDLRRQPSRNDENHVPENNRSFDKSSKPILSTVQRTKRQSKEDGESNNHQARFSFRPDTPISMGTRIVPSRYRQVSNSVHRTNPLNKSSDGCAAVTAAGRLLQEATSDIGSRFSRTSTSRGDMVLRSYIDSKDSSSYPNSLLCVSNTVARTIPDTRSSMTSVDKWRTERNSNDGAKLAGDCVRLMNLSSSMNLGGGNSLPPHPFIRQGFDVKKGKKASNHQEDVQSLKMFSNHHLQWRFANAKTEVSMKAQKQEAERKFYWLGGTISEIRDRVKIKCNELAVLRRIKTLTTVVKAQVPHLDEWATLEEDYSTSLSGTVNALLSSLTRIPVRGEVQADVGELMEALSSALKVLELIGSHIQRFITKAEEMDTSVSEVGKMVAGERLLIEDGGDLPSDTYTLQVKECSLRTTLVQLQSLTAPKHKTRKIKWR